MPIYRYHCDKCGKDYSFFEKMTDTHKRECPSCGVEMNRIYEPVGTVFKSGGFYSKDGTKDND